MWPRLSAKRKREETEDLLEKQSRKWEGRQEVQGHIDIKDLFYFVLFLFIVFVRVPLFLSVSVCVCACLHGMQGEWR